MPTKAHHRSRSSIDRVLDLLADLEDNQIALLLDDLNHTTPSNVPVPQAIALFEHGAAKPRRKHDRASSPVRTLQAELERRHSRRISSAPESRPRPKMATQPSAVRQSTPLTAVSAAPEPAKEPPSDRSERPSLTLSPPPPADRPRSSARPSPSPEPRPRSYKRISRPMLLSPTATAELHQLLLAYFSDEPSSTTSTATPSPATPYMGFSAFEPEPEPNSPGLDLLEPSPTRTPQLAAPGRSIRTTPSMSSLFEVLRSH